MARGAAARKLQLVSEEPAEVRGDPTLTQEAVAAWSPGQRKCRGRKRHNWGPHVVREHKYHYDVVERCTHCNNRRSADFMPTSHGIRQATKWKPDYREGYLLPKGAAGLDEDIRDELTAADILSRKMIEVPDDEEN